jgi:hypothetical protein
MSKIVSNKGVTPSVEESSRRVTPEPMPKSPSQPKDYDEVKGHKGVIAGGASGERKNSSREGFYPSKSTEAEEYSAPPSGNKPNNA